MLGVKVIRGRKIHTPAELDLVNDTTRTYFDGPPRSRYVVTDCDVDMSIAAPDALSIYDELLDQFQETECVGPMLGVRDIPRTYPLFNWAMNRHVDYFWQHTPRWTDTSAGRTASLGTLPSRRLPRTCLASIRRIRV